MKNLQQSHILFAGPVPPPVTGQSFSFNETITIIDCKKKIVVNQNFEGEHLLIKYFITIFLFPKYLWLFLFRRIDLVYLTGTRSFQGSVKDMILISLAILFKKKIINHIHGADFKSFMDSLPRLYKRLVINAYRRIDCNVILLEKMRSEIEEFLDGRKLKVIANFYDPIFDTVGFDQKNNEHMVICYFSNLMFSKGILNVIEAFNKMDSRFSNVRLLLAGSYISDEYMTAKEIEEKVSAEINKNSRIISYGVLKGQEKVSFLSSANIFVLPSFYKSEAFPISVIEAMRSGCVLICAAHNYIKEIVTPEHGGLVPARDTDSLCTTMEYYLKDPSGMARISVANCNYAKANYSVSTYSNKINTLFQLILNS